MVCSMMETNSCNKSFTSSERNLIFVHSGSALLSTIMCPFACLVVVCLQLHRQIAYRLALYQILSTLFYSFTKVILTLLLINFNKENGYYIRACTATAFLVMYSLWVQQIATFHTFYDIPPFRLCGTP